VLTPAQLARDRATAAKIAPIIDAFADTEPHLLRDNRVVYVSNRAGLPAIYVADSRQPDRPPKKLPTPDERVGVVRVLPDERAVLFTSDVKSDGNFRIFRVNVDGDSPATGLTPGETLHRNWPAVARGVPGLFAYSANAVTDPAAKIFVQRADGSAPKEIHRDPQSGFVEDIAPDGRHVLFVQFRGQNDRTLFEIEVAGGQARRLFPPPGQRLLVSDPAYSADGRWVIAATGEEGRPSALVAIDRQSGRVVARYEETTIPTGQLELPQVSPAGDRVAVAVDAGNRSEVRVLDARTLRLERTVATGLGFATPAPFRADGKRFGLTISKPGAPNDIYEADARSGEIVQLRAEPRPGLSDLPPVAASIVEVSAFDGLKIPVNLYLPKGAARKMPTVVHVHGGPSASAYLSYDAEVRVLTSLGFAVVQPNIRGSTGFGLAFERADDREKRGDALKDIENVNAWARAQPWCDGRLVIMGSSYGGYMTLLALTRQPGIWQAGVDDSGMSDLKTMEQLEDQTIRIYDETEFGALGRDDALLAEWSPLKDMTKIVAPVFIYQGVNDPVTPREQADRMVHALRERKIPVEYMLLGDEGHGVVRRANRIAYLSRVLRFLEEHL
jgi:dipeptidyl aminopeptidase/acylaminoacyl peptidase